MGGKSERRVLPLGPGAEQDQEAEPPVSPARRYDGGRITPERLPPRARIREDLEVGYSAEFARQEIDGEFISFEERVYPGFDREVNVGYTNPSACLWGALDPDGQLRIEYCYKMLHVLHYIP